jgi:S1-C subfamily serine protease
MCAGRVAIDDGPMKNASLWQISNELADTAASVAASVVQVRGHRRPGTGLVYADDVVLTTTRALGREDGLHVTRPDGASIDAELIGWDPATNLALLRAAGIGLPVLTPGSTPPRVGHLALAIARSWSNALTASAGIVAVIGGPLPTGRRRAIDEVIRTTAPMHDGFSGGAFVDAGGDLIGVTTAARIRGLGVVIPASIAWKTAATVLEHGGVKRGYIGIAAHPVTLPDEQAGSDGKGAVLVTAVAGGSPAARGGVIVGDVILELDGHRLGSPEDLLDLLQGDRVGRSVTLRILRGGSPLDVAVTVEERPA